MPKRKSDGELVKFVWKRSVKYEVMLLTEVESKNPFAFKNAKQTWEEIANVLQNCDLKMKVTHRSCRERVNDLLKTHRREEQHSKKASGIEEPDMTELKQLLTSVAKLHECGQNKEMREVYAKSGRSEAEAIRNSALLAVQADDDFEDFTDDQHIINLELDSIDSNNVEIMIDSGKSKDNDCNPNRNGDVIDTTNVIGDSDGDIEIVDASVLEVVASTEVNRNTASKSTSKNSQGPPQSTSGVGTSTSVAQLDADLAAVQVFFNDDEEGPGEGDGDRSEKLLAHANSRKSNPKRDLVRYLENKSEKEIEIRKEELEIRKEELTIRKGEVDVKKMEAENKNKELDILSARAKADADNQKRLADELSDNQKRLTDVLLSVINRK